jgi:ubiquitin-like 1-activating enzyme E1 B
MDRYEAYRALYGAEGFEKLREAKVLIVGAGGIGCEILKNMVLMGFRSLEIIDLDTIDVSNLNRQFLFRPEHVGQSKALVASVACLRFNPECNVIPHHANIKDDMFNLQYFKGFDCVLNALDNVDARRHVNRLCLSANVPLIDSGSTGYRGQVRPIMKGVTECYECRAKTTQKVYPICTIRSTPDKPVHCIVWAKEAFKLVFGPTRDSMLYEDPSVEESTFMGFVPFPEFPSSAAGVSNPLHETAAGGSSHGIDIIQSVLDRGSKLLHGLFCAEVDKRIAMDVYKTAKIKPVRMDATAIDRALITAKALLLAQSGHAGAHKGTSSPTPAPTFVRPSKRSNWDRGVWSSEDCAVEAVLCHAEAFLHYRSRIGSLAFDKDDSMAMLFVTSMANLRARVFGIPAQSLYDAKGIAGNIVPAIATTNAIVAATQVGQACRVIVEGSHAVALLRNTSVWRVPTSRRREVLACLRYVEVPIETCFVCQKCPVHITIDTKTATLRDLVTLVLKAKLGFNAPSVSVGPDPIYEEGEGCDEDLAENLSLTLDQCPAGGVTDGSELTIEDFTQDMDIILQIHHSSREEIQQELLRRQDAAAKMGSGEAGAPPPDDIFYLDGSKTPVPSADATPTNSKRSSNELGLDAGDVSVSVGKSIEATISSSPAAKRVKVALDASREVQEL